MGRRFTLEYVTPNAIRTNPRNARPHDSRQIKQIQAWGVPTWRRRLAGMHWPESAILFRPPGRFAAKAARIPRRSFHAELDRPGS